MDRFRSAGVLRFLLYVSFALCNIHTEAHPHLELCYLVLVLFLRSLLK